jgi:hypothetical protein
VIVQSYTAAVPSASAPDPALCPLCGQANLCAMERQRETGMPQGPCWCTGMDFSADLLARVPATAQRLACVCETCARRGPAA